MKTRLFLTVAAFVAMTAIATAQTAKPAADQTGRGRAAGNVYVDADKDGVCDNYTNGTRQGRRAYSAGANQNAANRGPGKGQGQGQAAATGHGQGRGQGHSQGVAAGTGHGQGRGQGVAAGTGQGRGNGQGRFSGKGP
ncbi:MAG: hypothetical protein IH592_02455, partial [Bacteroidales bacterium]|nr:hypothetical protein [Bacteroidales bacterium]